VYKQSLLHEYYKFTISDLFQREESAKSPWLFIEYSEKNYCLIVNIAQQIIFRYSRFLRMRRPDPCPLRGAFPA
jgi:hypothetical protein